MQSLERRITELESQTNAKSKNLKVRLVPVEPGESNEQAITRAGYSPEDDETMFVCLVGLERSPQSSAI